MNDARRIAKSDYPPLLGDAWCWFCNARVVEHLDAPPPKPHKPDCPWLSLPKIVAALERAEATEGRLVYLVSRLTALAGEYEKWSHESDD